MPLRVVDGDTIVVAGERIRLMGFDTPEITHARCDEEKAAGRAARQLLQALLAEGAMTVERKGRDRYGRTLAHVRAGGLEAREVMIAAGLARPYHGGRRQGWCG